ncbi:hypothetical protein ACFQ3L_00950 [Lacticaseibacillus jixianensis]|uniref:Uncharacterized protein n=1 Tax=Lacticaseibacillus jixianensis TaxID=2486012 RepID=A0ABW4B784_9LACO|nr:hypothetical protein [Lacticaseibacillus jixianensis]
MTKRSGSALLSAIVLLALVTLISSAALQQFAAWRVDYQRRLRYEEQQFKVAYAWWNRHQPQPAGADEAKPE